MEEAAGSIPARSIVFYPVFAHVFILPDRRVSPDIMRIRDLILPEDQIFFTLFKDMAGKIKEAATTLNEITHELPEGTEKSTRCAS